MEAAYDSRRPFTATSRPLNRLAGGAALGGESRDWEVLFVSASHARVSWIPACGAVTQCPGIRRPSERFHDGPSSRHGGMNTVPCLLGHSRFHAKARRNDRLLWGKILHPRPFDPQERPSGGPSRRRKKVRANDEGKAPQVEAPSGPQPWPQEQQRPSGTRRGIQAGAAQSQKGSSS